MEYTEGILTIIIVILLLSNFIYFKANQMQVNNLLKLNDLNNKYIKILEDMKYEVISTNSVGVEAIEFTGNLKECQNWLDKNCVKVDADYYLDEKICKVL